MASSNINNNANNKENALSTKRNKYDRIVLLVDMDCFYCQVEEKLNPELRGRPMAVVQYNAWRGGGIIAVNYAARAKGVTRHMRGDEAKTHCPDIELVKVPNVREKADLTKYRDAGAEVASVLQQFTSLLERASVDEAYLDITHLVQERFTKMNAGDFVLKPQELASTFVVGYESIGQYVNELTTSMGHRKDAHKLAQYYAPEDLAAVQQSDIRLLIGASICHEIRCAVKAQTKYECSAGIAHNKIVAKLACGMNKPNKQTILPLSQILQLFDTLPIGKIKGLGGKFGEEVCQRANITCIGKLRDYTEEQLQRKFDEKNGTWLYYICRGIDFEAVTPRFYSKSIGCCKRFPGRNCITGLETLQHWLHELAGEISSRLEKDMKENSRRAKQMVVSFTQEFDGGEDVPSSRSMAIGNYDQEYLERNSLEVIKTNTKQFISPKNDKKLYNAIKFLGISVGKFETISREQYSLRDMFAKQRKSSEHTKINEDTVGSPTSHSDKQPVVTSTDLARTATTTISPHRSSNDRKSCIESIQKHYLSNDSETADNQSPTKSAVAYETDGNVDETIDKFDEVTEESSNNNKSIKATNDKKNSGILENKFFANYLKKVDNKSKEAVNENEHKMLTTESSKLEVKSNSTRVANKTINSFFLKTLSNQIGQPKILLKKLESAKRLANESQSSRAQDKRRKLTENKFVSAENASQITNDISKLEPSLEEKLKNNNGEMAQVEDQDNCTKIVGHEEITKFLVCDECNTKIPADERSVQLHRDHHYAYKLSQQFRTEYMATRKQTKRSASGIKDISMFFKPKNNNDSSTLGATDSVEQPSCSRTINCAEMVECPECDKLIEKSTLSEHFDFHMAIKIQEEVNKQNDDCYVVKNSNSKPNTGKLKTTKAPCPVTKPITKFFNQNP